MKVKGTKLLRHCPSLEKDESHQLEQQEEVLNIPSYHQVDGKGIHLFFVCVTFVGVIRGSQVFRENSAWGKAKAQYLGCSPKIHISMLTSV